MATHNEDYVLVLENAGVNVKVADKANYILEGPAAVFGVENNNHRIYEETEYLPHLEYLNEKIGKRKLLGELDHPEKFDVSLQKVSHLVENLTYDKSGRQVKIRVKLLDTPYGNIAKALVDNNVPLSISSRAAGVVKETKRVQIKKIFTYDLVADPGFETAQLERINESVNNGLTDLRQHSITNELNDITSNFDFKDENVKIYSLNETQQETLSKLVGEKKNREEMSKQYVTIDEMNEYSALLTAQLKREVEKLKSSTTAVSENVDLSTIENRLTKIEKYGQYLAENLDKTIAYSEYLAENVDKGIEYSKYLAENLDKSITYADYLAENLDKSITYADYLAENLDKSISFGDYLAENLEKGISYAEYLAENLDKSISYAEYLAENVDHNIAYSEYLAENVDKGIAYSEYLAENVDHGIRYSEYIAENLERGIGYSEYLAEKIEKNIAYSEYIAESVSVEAVGTKVNESASVDEVPAAVTNYKTLPSKIDSLLEAVKNQRTGSAINESKYAFFKILTDEKREEFLALDEAKKEKVTKALAVNSYFTEPHVIKIWEEALVEKVEETPAYIAKMPKEYKPIYEALSQTEKDGLDAQSKLYRLDTEYQVRNFWQTRRMQEKPVGLIKLNEGEQPSAVVSNVGYKNEYVSSVAAELAKRFK
jgi:hypothetical protein